VSATGRRGPRSPRLERSGRSASAGSLRLAAGEDGKLGELFFANAGTAFAILSLDLRVVMANDAMCELVGCSRDELVGEAATAIFPSRERSPAELREQARAAPNGRVTSERRLQRPDGEPVWVRVQTTLVSDPAGDPLCYVATAHDITAERRASDQLERERSELAEVEAIAQVGSWRWNLTTGEGSCSQELRRMFELPAGAPLTLQLVLAPIPEQEREWVRRRLLNALEDGAPFELDHHIVRRDGSEGLVHSRARIVERGGERWLVGTVQDVSERRQVERAAAEATERFVTAFEDAPIGMSIISTEGDYLQVNPALCAMLGYGREQLLERSIDSVMHPDDLDASIAMVRELVAGRRVTARYEKRFLHADGHVVWATVAASIVRNEAGEPLYLVAQVEDVSERRRAEQAASEASERFRGAFESSPIGMALSGPDGSWLQVNPALCAMLGYGREQLLDMTFQAVTHPDDRALSAEHMRRLLSGESSACQFEKRYLHADGHVVWVILSTSLVRDKAGEPLYFVTQVVDVSERKRLEELLRANAEALEEAQQLAQVGSFEWNLDTGEISNSRELHRIHGTDPDSFVPTMDWLLESVHEDDRERVRDVFLRARPGALEFRIVRADGAVRHVVCHARAGFDASGKPVRLYGAVQDVTERVEAEAARRELEARMQEAQRLESLGVLAGGIAHDFNNLLVGVLGNAGLAALELPPHSPARLLIDQIEIAARRAAELTKQMLAYSGRGQFVVQPLDLRVVVREMSALLETAIPKNVAVEYELAEQLPAVRADVAQIRQLVMNLITNAADAIGDAGGTIAIRIGRRQADAAFLAGYSLSEGLPEGAYVTLEVSDDGIGMDAETLSRIFDPFFTTKFSGHGLGLAAALGIVRGHHGAIRVESEVGRGSRFSLLLPAVEDVAEEPGAPGSAEAAWRAAGTILVVDDEEIVRRAARRILSTAGLEVVEAAGAAEALDLLSTAPERFDAAVIDLVMPGMSGAELVAALHEVVPGLPVVLTSGYDARAVVERLAETGAETDFLQKPYHPRELVDCLRRRLAEG
jgi:two-component system cell cycle sensor histidine kinase/response regulator CckA